MLIGSGKHRNAIDSDEEDDKLFEQIKNTRIVPEPVPMPKKRMPNFDTTPEKEEGMEIEGKTIRLLKFNELPEEVVFYLSDIYSFGTRLFISGVLTHGQTINIVATQPMKELYFCLKSEYSGSDITEERKVQAKR